MNSTYEGYALLLRDFEIMQKQMENLKLQMSFVWSNTKESKFTVGEKRKHAAKEFSYLENGLERLKEQITDMQCRAQTFRLNYCSPQAIEPTESS